MISVFNERRLLYFGSSPSFSSQAEQRTGLSVGLEERTSAKARRQGAYRQQLEQQMREQQEMKKREKAERLSVPSSQEKPLSQRGSPSSKIPTSNTSATENLASLKVSETSKKKMKKSGHSFDVVWLC